MEQDPSKSPADPSGRHAAAAGPWRRVVSAVRGRRGSQRRTNAVAVAEGHGSVAISGDVHAPVSTNVVVLPPEAVREAADVEAHGLIDVVAPKATFTGRAAELAAVRAELTRGDGPPPVVLRGLGGVGKSELARQYAHLHRDAYDLIWWIESAVPGATDTALAAITTHLSPHWAGTDPPPSLSARVAWAKSWLQQHDRWLLIHNNVEDPALVGQLVGGLRRGHHLVTSRYAAGWQARTSFVDLGLLPRTDAVGLLRAWAPFESPQELWHAGQLAQELGDLPLALEQAGAYMNQTAMGVAAYRSRLRDLIREIPLDLDGPERGVHGVWALTLDALEGAGPLSVELLHTLAWLGPDGFPRELLDGLAPDPVQVTTALGLLRAYSMVTLSRAEVTVHRLVQEVLRDRATREAAAHTTAEGVPPAPRGREDAERILLEALYPNGVEEDPDEALLARLSAHVTALATTDPGTHRAELTKLFADTAMHQRRAGQTIRALPLLEAYARQTGDGFGPEHEYTLTARNAVVLALVAAGRLDRAAAILDEIGEQSIRTLGPGHITTLNIRANRASAYLSGGQLQRAADEFAAAAADSSKHLGPAHPRTLILLNGLAGTYKKGHLFERAIEIYQDLLRHEHGGLVEWQDDSTVLQLNAANVRNNLAGAYGGAGKHAESIATYREALAELTHRVGADHPTTLDCLGNLGYALDAAGQAEEASGIYRKVLERREHVLGENHPDTLLAQSNLAYLLLTGGEVEAGLELCRRTLVQREQVLGELHVDTLLSRTLLASAHDAAGHPEEAAELLETALRQRREVLGTEHPDTLLTLSNYGMLRFQSGDPAGAAPMLEEALATQERLYGAESSTAMVYRNNLAVILRESGARDRSRALFTTVLEQRTRLLGAEHRDTLASLAGLARLHHVEGDLHRAVALYESALAALTGTVGPDHPTTRTVAGYLAEARRA